MRWFHLVCLCIACTVTQVYASYGCDPELSLNAEDNPIYSFGVNYKQTWIKPKGQWKPFFVSTQPGFDVYFGWRFHPNWDIELGYEWTANKTRSLLIPNNTTVLGITNNTGFSITSTSKVRYKTGHADLNAFIPIPIVDYAFMCDLKPEVILSFGIAATKPSIKIFMTPNTLATSPFVDQFIFIQGRSHAVARVGLGFQAMVIENVGARILWRYENTSVLRARNSPITSAAATREIFSNGNSLAAGLFIKW